MSRALKINFISLSFYGVPLLAYIVFFIVPSLSSLLLSFTSWDGFVKTIDFIGVRNYVELFQDERFYASMLNTLQIAVIYTIIVNVLAIVLAIAVDKVKHFTYFYKSGIFIPNILAPVIIGFIWTFVLSYNFGFLNTLLDNVGLEVLKKDWLGDRSLVKLSISAVFIWQGLGFFFMVYLAGLQGIPQDIYEAAKIDGAKGLSSFLYIKLPLLWNAMTICLTLSVIGSLKLFDQVFVLTYGGPGFASETIALYIYNAGFVSNRNGYGSAISVIMFLLVLIITVVQLKILKRKEVEL
jgi:ABC-type sugar transport system permease subunit